MSRRATGKPFNDARPWEGAGLGLDPATTTRGALETAVRQAFPDVTLIELAWAMPPLPAPGWLQPGRIDEASAVVARGRALREARGGRADLPEDDWLQLVRLVHPTLSEQERQNPKDILAAIAALRPPREPDAPLARRGPGAPMTVSPDGSLETPGDDLPSNEVTSEEIERWLAANPDAVGLGIAPGIILAEKDREMRRVAAEKVRATRLDLTDEEFERLAMDAQPKLSGRRETMVAELRAIVAAYRPPRGDDNTVATPLARRRPGRPGWTAARFRDHWREAESKSAPGTQRSDVAVHFRSLDGTIGVTPHHLWRLRRRFTRPTETPE